MKIINSDKLTNTNLISILFICDIKLNTVVKSTQKKTSIPLDDKD